MTQLHSVHSRLILTFLVCGSYCAAGDRVRPHIAEPMVFDLVRPLGAEKGELEANNLARRVGSEWLWAPEIEYAFADGYSIELELPFEGQHVAEYKAALQGTLGTHVRGRLIHGWQGIGIRSAGAKLWSTDALYLAGYQIDRRWSVFSMTGLRHVRTREHRQNLALHNPSVFLQVSRRVIVGFENNFAWGTQERKQRMHMPQLHLQLSKNNLLQFGYGWEKAGSGHRAPVLGFRLVRQLKGPIED